MDPNHFPARPVAPVGSPAVAGAGAADGRHGGRSIALSIFLGSLSLLALALALSVLLVVYRLTLAGSSATSGLGASLQTAGQAVTGSVQTAVQSVQDATDPFHPPRYAIRQDPEFDELRTVGAGGSLGTSSTDRFTVVRIVQRPEAGLPDQRVYALVHQQLIVPKVTKVLGITIHTDDGAKDYALYRGQEFGIGGHTYKINGLSVESQQVGILRYRQATDARGPLVFDQP